MTELEQHIRQTPLIDTHEHLLKEEEYLSRPHDILCDLFNNYVTADLVVAGAQDEAVKRLVDPANPDISSRFLAVRDAWERCRNTGYGEAVQIIASRLYGIDELTPAKLIEANDRAHFTHTAGARLKLLRDEANLDHVQIDDFRWACEPDESGPSFFLYDISWQGFCAGYVEPQMLLEAVGVEVKHIASLKEAMAALFAKWAPCAIAVKSQHAYQRTLYWEERTDSAAEKVLAKALAGKSITAKERLLLGDWCTARGVELAGEHNLPFKIHTGYYAGYGYMRTDRINAGHLCGLLAKYPQTRFVLMHIAYPYSDEIAALAKHYPNAYIDLCWAWSIDPYSACDFVRRMIHAAPANKLFAFGGDSWIPSASLAYSLQARWWMTHALQSEIKEGFLTESQAKALATRFMQTNQRDCFDIEGARRAVASAMAVKGG